LTQWIKRKGTKYYAELKGNPNTTICWNKQETEFWLFINNEPIAGTFKDADEAKQRYEELR